jgi:hypothetical protein
LVPDRARRFLQIALIMIGMITVIAIPMIFLWPGSSIPIARERRIMPSSLWASEAGNA